MDKLEKTKLYFNGNQNVPITLDIEDIIDKINEIAEWCNEQDKKNELVIKQFKLIEEMFNNL
jgi:hypothetical protein